MTEEQLANLNSKIQNVWRNMPELTVTPDPLRDSFADLLDYLNEVI